MKILALIVLAGWLLALARTIVNLIAVPRLTPRLPRRFPLVSVIVPARDEERAIEAAVSGLLAQTYPALEIVVVDDRSSDATPQILARVAAADQRLRVLRGEEPPQGWLGKPWALHQGAGQATGAIFLFVDADVVYSPDAVAAAVAWFEDSPVAMASLLPRFEMRGFWENVAMPYLAFVAFSMLPLWLTNRTRIPLLAVGGGPGNLIRREDYEAIGGHERLRDAVVDDIGLARLVRRHGHRTAVVRAGEMISVRMYHGLREIVRGFTKNLFPALGRSYPVFACYVAFSILFHLWPFAMALTGDGVALATVGVITLIRLLLFRSLGFRAASALLGHPLMMALWLWIGLRSVWLTGIRRRVVWRGRSYDAAGTRFGGER
jgi:chlorobactene glucosyltransferase